VAVAKWKYALFLWAVMQSSNRSTTASGFSSSIQWLMPCRVFQTVFAGDVATALLNTLLHDRDVAVAPDERRWAGYLVANSPGFSCGSA
jgi:hypothetical protein